RVGRYSSGDVIHNSPACLSTIVQYAIRGSTLTRKIAQTNCALRKHGGAKDGEGINRRSQRKRRGDALDRKSTLPAHAPAIAPRYGGAGAGRGDISWGTRLGRRSFLAGPGLFSGHP